MAGKPASPPSTAAADQDGEHYSTIDINGTKLAYRDVGKGSPMVLVHANITDIRAWAGIENDLAQHFRLITYSRRYYWPNEPIADGMDDPWHVHADDLGALIDKLAIAPVHLVGSSSGAFIAMLLARRRPELFTTLILQEPPVLSIFLP